MDCVQHQLDKIGTYFVGEYYNTIFAYAKRQTAITKNTNIRNEYRTAVVQYYTQLENNHDVYAKVIQKLQSFFIENTTSYFIPTGRFVDTILTNFTPSEFFPHLKAHEKDSMLHTIITSLANELGSHCISSDIIIKITSNREVTHPMVIRTLQEFAVAHLLSLRDAFLIKYTNPTTGGLDTDSITMRQCLVKTLSDKVNLQKK